MIRKVWFWKSSNTLKLLFKPIFSIILTFWWLFWWLIDFLSSFPHYKRPRLWADAEMSSYDAGSAANWDAENTRPWAARVQKNTVLCFTGNIQLIYYLIFMHLVEICVAKVAKAEKKKCGGGNIHILGHIGLCINLEEYNRLTMTVASHHACQGRQLH